MTEDTPTVITWMGVPLNEIPRDQLEQELVNAWTELGRLRKENADKSVNYIRDIAAMAKRIHEAKKPFFYKLLDRVFV